MKRIRIAALLFVLSACAVVASAVPIIRNGSGSGSGSAAGTATPTISAPTAVPTAGNVVTLSKFGTPSYATHDMIVCVVEQNNGTGNTLSSNSSGIDGWFYLASPTALVSSGTWIDLVGHCIQPSEQATYSFGLTNSVATQQACVLLRNTGCGQDNLAVETNTATATVNYSQYTTVAANSVLIYGAIWTVGASNISMSANPAGLVVDATVTGIGSTSDGVQIGHIPVAVPTTIAAATGTLSASTNNGTIVGAIAPLH